MVAPRFYIVDCRQAAGTEEYNFPTADRALLDYQQMASDAIAADVPRILLLYTNGRLRRHFSNMKMDA